MADIAPVEGLARFVFRGGGDAEARASEAFGLAFPGMNRFVAAGARIAMRLGPDEFLLLAPEAESESAGAAIRAAMGEVPHGLVEVTDRHLGFMIVGGDSALRLNAGCPLDLAPRAFPVGMATRTLYLKAEIILWRMREDLFRVEVLRSFAPYLRAMWNEPL